MDNMCILVNALKRQDLNLNLEARVGLALAEVGPSITLASLAEVLAFAVGSFTPMPACKVFSLFAGTSDIPFILSDHWITMRGPLHILEFLLSECFSKCEMKSAGEPTWLSVAVYYVVCILVTDGNLHLNCSGSGVSRLPASNHRFCGSPHSRLP